MTTTQTTELVPTTEIRVGDSITEMNTPSGPFYPVLKVNAKTFVVDARAMNDTIGEAAPLPIRLPRSAGAGVLRAMR